MNSLRGSLSSLKSEGSSTNTKLQQHQQSFTASLGELDKPVSSTDLDQTGSSLTLTPSSLNLQGLRFDSGGEVEVQSPDWDSYFADHFDSSDFMISSPALLSPQLVSSYNSCAQGMLTTGCSPPRFAPFGTNHQPKPKGMSPLHKVFNSPSSQFMHIESLTLPAIEEFLNDDYSRHDLGAYSLRNAGSSSAMLDHHHAMSMHHQPSRFGRGSCQGSGSTQMGIDQSDVYRMGSMSSCAGVPLSQQLKQEDEQEQQLQHSLNHSLMGTMMAADQEHDSGLQLVHLLLACAEAVAKEDYMTARRYLQQLNQVVTPLGDSMQRVAACFTEALSARLAAALTPKPSSSAASQPFNPFPPNSLEILKIYQILYQACPYIKFAHFTANQAIFEAFESEMRVHVIDLDILQGYQWPAFMQALAARPGGAPFLRITGVGSSPEAVMETGRCLTELAHSLHVPFEFHPVGEQLEDLKPHMLNRRVGEALAVNSVNRLHRVPPHCLGNLLTMIREQAPNIVTIVEQEASHNGPYFLGRFLEALHCYSAIFDSLDATFPQDSAQRAKVEQYIFAQEIKNIVACEGPERVMRHERLEKWRKIMEGRGFKEVPLSSNAVTQSKILLGLYSCDGYRLTEDKGCLLLGWQDRAILAASAWRC
uniref:Uncharacterized protein n=1 Tax=Kalanchoe fedtschenkoi TaxID=63787 RepID=A0A7N0UPC9_KALFE